MPHRVIGPLQVTADGRIDGFAKGDEKCALPSVWMVIHFCMESIWISNKMALTTAKASDTEKITINLSLIDLGQIDLLVQEGFYSNRTDFIRTAIRNHLATHAEVVRQTVSRKTLVLGLQEFTRADLEAVKKSGKRLRIQVLGLARIASDVSAALALATIESVSVLGAFHASPAVKAALIDRIH